MRSNILSVTFSLLLAPLASVAADNLNIAMYWGQNSAGQKTTQKDLATYCATIDFDVVMMSFMTSFNSSSGTPTINLANIGDTCTLFSGTELLHCPQVAEDIKTCQNTYGKYILLSIGGATYTEGGFQSADAATQAAESLWETFGPKKSGSSAKRPFDDAEVDGFDLDFESTVQNMVPFTTRLRELMDADTVTSGKRRYLTAAPQCVYPDAADREMLLGGTSFDAIWVQFYNNFCGLQSFVSGSDTQTNFNYQEWDTWARTNSKNKDVKIFLGVPASSTAAGSGYQTPQQLAPIITWLKKFDTFGGVMAWDMSQAVSNSGFMSGVSGSLASGSGTKRKMRRGWRKREVGANALFPARK